MKLKLYGLLVSSIILFASVNLSGQTLEYFSLEDLEGE